MHKLFIRKEKIELMLTTHENNYPLCYGLIYGTLCYTDIEDKKTYILNGGRLVCIINCDAIMHQQPLSMC